MEAAIAQASEASPVRTPATADLGADPVRRRPAPVAAVARPAGSADDLHIPLRGVRRTIADRMTTSRREIPDATTWVDADATALMEAKDAIRAARPERRHRRPGADGAHRRGRAAPLPAS